MQTCCKIASGSANVKRGVQTPKLCSRQDQGLRGRPGCRGEIAGSGSCIATSKVSAVTSMLLDDMALCVDESDQSRIGLRSVCADYSVGRAEPALRRPPHNRLPPRLLKHGQTGRTAFHVGVGIGKRVQKPAGAGDHHFTAAFLAGAVHVAVLNLGQETEVEGG